MKAIRFILLLIVFTACRPVKQITESKQTSESFSNETAVSVVTGKSDEKQSSDQKTNIFTDIVNQVDESTNIKITEYDTSKPVDPGTGKPPTLKETVIDNTKKSKVLDQSIVNTESKENKSLSIDVQSAETTQKQTGNSETESQKTITEKSLTWYQVFFIRAGKLFLLLVLCSIFLISYRFFPNWIKFFKRLIRIKR